MFEHSEQKSQSGAIYLQENCTEEQPSRVTIQKERVQKSLGCEPQLYHEDGL